MSTSETYEPEEKGSDSSPPSSIRSSPRQLKWIPQRPSRGTTAKQQKQEMPIVPVQSNFQFVGETGVARPAGKFRTAIRSQARSRRQPRTKECDPTKHKLHDLLPREESFSDVQTESSSALVPNSSPPLEPLSAFAVFTRNPGANTVDPFGALCIPGDVANTLPLLRHYRFVFLETQTSTSFKDELLRYAMSDPALLHSALAHSALHLSSSSLNQPSSDLLYHKGQAIELLNTRIQDPNLQSAINTTFCAVACMTHLEIVSGTMESIKVHANGLGALVRSRGGIQALACYPLTMGYVFWTDTIASLIMDTEPCIQLDELPPSQPQDFTTPSPFASLYQEKLCKFTGLQLLAQEINEVYKGLRHFTAVKDNLASSHDISELQPLLDMTERLDRRLTKIIRSEALSPPNNTTAIYKLFGTAALIHQIMFIRQAPTRLSLSNILSSRMRILLTSIELEVLRMQYPEMMLWILMIAGIGGAGTPNQGWFAALLADACLASGLLARDEIAMGLKGFLWSNQYLGSVSLGFWDDVVRAQGAKGWG